MATTLTTPTAQPTETQLPWTRIAWFGALLAICYAPVLFRLGHQWATDGDMGHGFIVPLFAGYVVWQRRAALAAIPAQPSPWGLALIAWGALQLMIGTLGAELFLSRTSFLISLAGVILYLGGWKVLKALTFPLGVMILMVPIPAIVYARITLPLQLFASQVAETMLGILGIPVIRDGNVLELASQPLSVAEACSGIRSLLTLSFVSIVYGYLSESRAWMRWVLLIATIPIAIGANAARVTITGILSEIRTDLAQGFFHEAEGMVLFIVSLILMVLFHQAATRIAKVIHGRKAA